VAVVMDLMPEHDEARYHAYAARKKYERSVFRRSPKAPKPTDDELLALYGRMTAKEVAAHLVVRYDTVRMWIWNAQKRAQWRSK